MAEPWFDANQWAWLPGTVLGCLSGLWGSLMGALAPQGKGRSFVFGMGFLLAVLTTICVIAGFSALAAGQPFGVWFFLVVPLLPADIVVLALLCLVPRIYRQAEQRHMTGGTISSTARL